MEVVRSKARIYIPILLLLGLGWFFFYPKERPMGHPRSFIASQQLESLKKQILLNENRPHDVLKQLRKIRNGTSQNIDEQQFYQAITDKLNDAHGYEISFPLESKNARKFIDPWQRPYKVKVVNAGPTSATLQVWSLGKNGLDDAGKKDDILIHIDLTVTTHSKQ